MIPTSTRFNQNREALSNIVTNKLLLVFGNIAQGLSVIASSSFGANYPASAITNGNFTHLNYGLNVGDAGFDPLFPAQNVWQSAGEANPTIIIDLGSIQPINRVQIFGHPDLPDMTGFTIQTANFNLGPYYTQQTGFFSVSGANKGNKPVPAVSVDYTGQVTTNATYNELLFINVVNCRFIKITCTAKSDTYIRISQVAVSLYQDVTADYISLQMKDGMTYNLRQRMVKSATMVLKNDNQQYTPANNPQMVPNILLDVWSGFSGEIIRMGRFLVDNIVCNATDKTCQLLCRDTGKILFNNDVTTDVKSFIRNENMIEYVGNVLNISSSLMNLDSTGALQSYCWIAATQAWTELQAISQASGLAQTYFDVNGVLKMISQNQSASEITAPPNPTYTQNGENIVFSNDWLFFLYGEYSIYLPLFPTYKKIMAANLKTGENAVSLLGTHGGPGVMVGGPMVVCNGKIYFDGFFASTITGAIIGIPASVGSSNFAPIIAKNNNVYFFDKTSSPWQVGVFDTIANTFTSFGHPGTESIVNMFFDNGNLNVLTSIGNIYSYSAGVFTLVCNIPGATIYFTDSGSGIYFVCNGTPYSLTFLAIHKLYNGLLTTNYHGIYPSGFVGWNANNPTFSTAGKIIFSSVNAGLDFAQVWQYDLVSGQFTLCFTSGYVNISSRTNIDIAVALASASDAKLLLYAPGAAPGITPVATFNYSSTLLSLEKSLTDELGGDNSIINDAVASGNQIIADTVLSDLFVQPTTITIRSGLSVTINAVLSAPAINETVVLTAYPNTTGLVMTFTPHVTNPTVTIMNTNVGMGANRSVNFTIQGNKLNTSSSLSAETKDAGSIAKYGKRLSSISNKYVCDVISLQLISGALIDKYKTPQSIITSMKVAYSPNLEIGDLVTVVEINTGTNENYYVINISHNIKTASADTTLQLVKA